MGKFLKGLFKALWPDSMKGKAWKKETGGVEDKGAEVSADWKF